MVCSAFVELLARQLVTKQVLFFTGAGLSANWGIPTGGQLASEYVDRFIRDVDRQICRFDEEHWLKKYKCHGDLPMVAEILGRNKCWFIRHFLVPDVAKNKGVPLAPPYEEVVRTDPVAAGYIGAPQIVMARLAKEGILREVVTTNVDPLHEAGCVAVGMERVNSGEGDPALPVPWVEAFRVVANKAQHAEPLPGNKIFTVQKIHGCLDEARRVIREIDRNGKHECRWDRQTEPCHRLEQRRLNLVFTFRELLNWRTDLWARDFLTDRVRNHHMVFVGFSASDAVIHATLRDILEEVLDDPSQETPRQRKEEPRVQTITKDVAPPMAAVLRTAGGDEIQEDSQIHRVNSPSQVNEFFVDIYNETIIRLLERQFAFRGGAALYPYVPEEKRPFAQSLAQEMSDYLRALSDSPTFLYGALPAAVRLAWLASDPSFGFGQPAPGSGQVRRPHDARFARPYYYVPLTYRDDLTLVMLRAYYVLLGGKTPTQANAQVYPNGWVRLPPTIGGSAMAVLPILWPKQENLAPLARLRSLAPPPLGTAVAVLLTQEESRDGVGPVSAVLQSLKHPSATGTGPWCPFPISVQELWSGALKGERDWLESRLRKHVREVPCFGSTGVA